MAKYGTVAYGTTLYGASGAGASFPSTVSSQIPFAWWRLSETSGELADQMGRFQSRISGTVTRGVSGPIDKAITFDGSTGYVITGAYPRPSLYMTYPGVSVFNADTAANKTTWTGAHGSAVTIQAFWDRLQTSQGAALNSTEVTNLNTQISDARANNLEVVLEITLHYPPTWVLTAVTQFKDQNGTLWSGPGGENVRDWVFTSTGRTIVSDFVSKVLAAITNLNQNVQHVRLGGGFFGEMHYPRNGAGPNYQFWAYGTAPQAGTGLASDQTVCPLPGYVPFYDAARTDPKDAQWLNWYWQSYGNFVLWLIDQHRSGGYANRVYCLHPGAGIRSNQLWTNANYQQGSAAAENPGFLMDVYKVRAAAYPWCTWLDSTDGVTPPVNDTDKATWRKVRDEATTRGLDTDLWGENAGGNDATALSTMFGSTGSMKNGYKGVSWVNFPSLSPTGPLSTLTADVDAVRNAVTAAGTLVCFAKLPNNPANNSGLIGWRNDTTADFYLLQLLGTNTLEFRFRNSSGTAFTGTSSAVSSGVTHHFALVLNGTTMTLYADAVQIGQVTGISGKMASTGLLQIGQVAGNYSGATIAEPMLFDRALTTTEIQAQVTASGADSQAPTVPSGLVAVASGANRVDLSWNAATDNVAVTGYSVYRGGSLLTTVGAVTSYTDASVVPSTAYTYTVDAFDAASNHSAQSSSASATTPSQTRATGWQRLARVSLPR